jgi:regulator of sigma E protease
MLNILVVLIVLGILITVHEYGHLLAARLFRVNIEKFSIGFGPKLVAFKKNGVEYRISLIPLGGYLKMKGENPEEQTAEEPDSFQAKAWWKRALIAFSGPMANLILAILIFIMTFAIGRTYEDSMPIIGQVSQEYHQKFEMHDEVIQVNDHDIRGWTDILRHLHPEDRNLFLVERNGEIIEIETEGITPQKWASEFRPYSPPIIGDVAPGMPAYRAGLSSGDKIVAVNDNPISTWSEMQKQISEAPEDVVKLRIEREEQILEREVSLEDNIMTQTRIIGITQYMPVEIEEHYNIFESIYIGTASTIGFVALNYVTLYRLIANPSAIRDSIGGPVMIYTISVQTAEKGFIALLSLVATISIMLMIMNLLPIPVLDGGHIMFCLIEGIIRRPLSLKLQAALQHIGIILLLALMLFAFVNDFDRIFQRSSALRDQSTVIER